MVRVSELTKECRKETERLKDMQREFCGRMRMVREKIEQDSANLKEFVDQTTARLLQELDSRAEGNLEMTESHMAVIDQHIQKLEWFRDYIGEVKNKGTPADLAKMIESLHEKADNLQSIPHDVDFALDMHIDFFPAQINVIDGIAAVGRITTLDITEPKGNVLPFFVCIPAAPLCTYNLTFWCSWNHLEQRSVKSQIA